MQVFLSSFLHRSRAISIPNSPSPVLLPNPAPATSLAYELNATARRHGTNLTSTERQELLAAAKNLVAELEDPEEAVWRLCMMVRRPTCTCRITQKPELTERLAMRPCGSEICSRDGHLRCMGFRNEGSYVGRACFEAWCKPSSDW